MAWLPLLQKSSKKKKPESEDDRFGAAFHRCYKANVVLPLNRSEQVFARFRPFSGKAGDCFDAKSFRRFLQFSQKFVADGRCRQPAAAFKRKIPVFVFSVKGGGQRLAVFVDGGYFERNVTFVRLVVMFSHGRNSATRAVWSEGLGASRGLLSTVQESSRSTAGAFRNR